MTKTELQGFVPSKRILKNLDASCCLDSLNFFYSVFILFIISVSLYF